MMKKNKGIIQTLILTCLLCLFLFPVLVLINSSLLSYNDLISWPPKWFQHFVWQNYTDVVTGPKSIVRPFINSLQISTATMLLCIFIGLLASYAVTRFNFLGKKFFLLIILITQMFSSVLLISPMYVTFRALNLLDTKLALILSSTATSLPMTVWLLHAYLSQIPMDYEEASWMDGSTRFQGIFHIVLPLAFPGIMTAGLFAFIAAWGDLMFAKTFITSPHLRTISLALTNFRDLYKTTWETQMAASVLTSLPPFLIFLLIQQHLIRGMTQQGIKG